MSTRDPSKVAGLKQRGVRVCKGDFADPESLRKAFDGAEQVLIVSGTAMGADGVRQQGNAVQAARTLEPSAFSTPVIKAKVERPFLSRPEETMCLQTLC